MINIWLIRKETGEEFHIEQQASGKTLLAILQEHQIYMDAFCGGSGDCGRCLVQFLEGVPAPTEKEKRLLSGAELENGIRLACAVNMEQDCKILLPSTKREQIAVLGQVESRKLAEKQIPKVSSKTKQSNLGEDTIDTQITARQQNPTYGIAIDIGTTTLAAVLIHLSNGERMASASSVNHQRAYGADVISRIQASNEGKGTLLQKSIQSDLQNLMEQLVQQAGLLREQVRKVVIAANTTMCHLLRGLSCKGLGASPFTPEDISIWEGSIGELLNTECWQARAVIFPGISAFVGADIVAGIYASEMDRSERIQMLLDIGTNGEMVLGNRDGLLVTSAAAGPVFEGGNISCGVPGIPGAVTHVILQRGAEESDNILTGSYETIQNAPPVGLCGTGIIDVISELVRLSIVDENGTMAEPWFENAVPVAGENIVFTQSDVREVQMGKSAIRAGMETLLLETAKERTQKLSEQERAALANNAARDVDIEVLLAGGFGYYMDVKKAIRIGLFPQIFDGKIRMIGNSALEGAVQFLIDGEQEAKDRIERIVANAKEINLAMHPAFNDLYLQHMFF